LGEVDADLDRDPIALLAGRTVISVPARQLPDGCLRDARQTRHRSGLTKDRL